MCPHTTTDVYSHYGEARMRSYYIVCARTTIYVSLEICVSRDTRQYIYSVEAPPAAHTPHTPRLPYTPRSSTRGVCVCDRGR